MPMRKLFEDLSTQGHERVLFCSSFQHPFYPHRYYDLERPNIVNTPLPAGTGSRPTVSAPVAAPLAL